MIQPSNLGSIRSWRIFAAITFMNQLVRVPLLLTLSTSSKDLDAYFVISATSIPVQFIAHDILQYRSKNHPLMLIERFGLPLFVFVSIAYVVWHSGLVVGGAYLAFAVALLLYGASVGRLRGVFPAGRVLAMDALYNTCATIVAIAAVLFVQDDGSKLGLTVILLQAAAAVAISGLNLLSIPRQNHFESSASSQLDISSSRTRASTTLVLIGIMGTTQLERLIIATVQPVVLACISLAAGAMQSWRKIGMDDAVVFERLHRQSDNGLRQAMHTELKHARYIFYPTLLITLIASLFVSDIAAWCSANGLLRSMDRANYDTTADILCIYLAIMPPAIVMINTLRQNSVALHRFGWWALILVAVLEIVALAYPYALAQHINLPIVMIIITASLSHTLFVALCPAKLNESFRILSFDVVVFILVILKLIWMPAH